MALTDTQRLARRDYLGATDMAALLGVNPRGWSQPLDVFAEKRPDIWPQQPRTQSEMMGLGHLLEEPVAQVFTATTGLRVRRLPGGGSAQGAVAVRRLDRPWEGANPDRMVLGGGPLDCKVTMRHQDEWPDSDGVSGTPAVPARYAAQVQWQMHVTARDHGYLAVLLGFGRFRWYRLQRDGQLIDTMRDIAELFWHENVVPGVPPDPDGSDGYESLLRNRYPTAPERELVATPYQAKVLRDRRAALDRADAAKVDVAVADQILMAAMADRADSIVAPDARVTWRQNKPSRSVDWEAVAWDAAWNGEAVDYTAEALSSLASDHTTTKAGARPFRVTYSDSDEE